MFNLLDLSPKAPPPKKKRRPLPPRELTKYEKDQRAREMGHDLGTAFAIPALIRAASLVGWKPKNAAEAADKQAQSAMLFMTNFLMTNEHDGAIPYVTMLLTMEAMNDDYVPHPKPRFR